jgi:uncharacterized protein (DUF697 family)/GTP-binding protein EngB required for normal cell division
MAAFTVKDLMKVIEGILEHQPFMNKFRKICEEEEQKLGRINILIAGKTGSGKSTLVNAVFGAKIAETGIGRPVTDGVTWYEPSHLPLRLCDTRGLELQNFDETLKELQKEIDRASASGKVQDRLHILWLVIQETGARIEDGERKLLSLCDSYKIPGLVVLTKATFFPEFQEVVRREMPLARDVVRVLAEGCTQPPLQSFGLPQLIEATTRFIPEATHAAFDAAQRIDIGRKRSRALAITGAAAAAAGGAALTPIPVADAVAVFAVNSGMLAAIAAVMGIQLSRNNVLTLAGSMLGAMGFAAGGRLIAGELLKLVPGFGSVSGGLITSGVASSATYGLGYGFSEFLCRFFAAEHRMPDGSELQEGFARFWENWDQKEKAAPHKGVKVNEPALS